MGPYEAAIRKQYREAHKRLNPLPPKLEVISSADKMDKMDISKMSKMSERMVVLEGSKAVPPDVYEPLNFRGRPEVIQALVAYHYGLHRSELLCPRRYLTLVRPRQVAMMMCL